MDPASIISRSPNHSSFDSTIKGTPMEIEDASNTSLNPVLTLVPSDAVFESRLKQIQNKRRAEIVTKEFNNLEQEGSPCKKLKMNNAVNSLGNKFLGLDEISENLDDLITSDFSLLSNDELMLIKSSLENRVIDLNNSLSLPDMSDKSGKTWSIFNGVNYEKSKIANTLGKVLLMIKYIELDFLPVELATHPAYIKKATQIAIEAGFKEIEKNSKLRNEYLHLAVREFINHYITPQISTFFFRPCSSITRQKVTILPTRFDCSFKRNLTFEKSLGLIDSTFKETLIDCSFFVVCTSEDSGPFLHTVMAYNMNSVQPEYYCYNPDAKALNPEKFNSLKEMIALKPNLKPYNFSTTPYNAYSVSLSALIDSWNSSK